MGIGGLWRGGRSIQGFRKADQGRIEEFFRGGGGGLNFEI